MTNPSTSTSSGQALGRREFLKKSAYGAGLLVLPSYVVGRAPGVLSPNNRINIAIVGAGGRGSSHVTSSMAENIVALCDVDIDHVQKFRHHSNERAAKFDEALTECDRRGVPWYNDYRVMLEEMGDKIDAVVVCTPDHMHYPIALSSINRGKHVYCEKPLTHTVEEARLLAEAAAKAGVVTQMGNQGHSNNGARLVKEWLDAGIIGEVREVHSWTDRPAAYWQQGLPRPDHSTGSPTVPANLKWDLWLGVATERTYDPAYAPFKWRAYADFGCGALGDMGCHIMDSAIWGLDLHYPESIRAASSEMNGYSYPESALVTYQFPARGKKPPLTYHWYSGSMYPPVPAWMKESSPFQGTVMKNGSLIIGEGMAILVDTYGSSVRILPRDKFIAVREDLPPPTLPRVEGSHFEDWTRAIRHSGRACSDFSYAGPTTETVLLGAAAILAGRELRFDATTRRFVDDPEADALLTKSYRDGWILS